MQSRYYDPTTCRFINADSFVSTGQGILGYNMFAYCRNNPTSRKDVSGNTDEALADDDTNLLGEEKEYAGGKLVKSDFSGGNGQFKNVDDIEIGVHDVVKPIDKSTNPLENIEYTQKVLQQMQLGDYHSFPAVVDNYGSYGTMTVSVGADGKIYYKLIIPGYYGSSYGNFTYMWDANNNCNHRLFEVYK